MPFSAADYRIGQLYTIAKKSKLESVDSKNGVKINVNEPYSNGPGGCGQYTNKTYYMTNRIPEWMKRLLPDSAVKLKEESWNAYPYSKNKFSNPLVDKFRLEIESRYIDGPPTLANVFDLEVPVEKSRSIVMIDIANDKYRNRKADQSEFSDQKVLDFEPLFRGHLTRNWLQDYELAHLNTENNPDAEPKARLMTCYKLCRVNFPVWPIQNRVEQFVQQYCRDTIVEAHRQAWLWQDEWIGMSLDDIRSMEKDTQSHLSVMMRQISVD